MDLNEIVKKLEERIDALEQELEDAWEHNRLLQRILTLAKRLGHNVEKWIDDVLKEIEGDNDGGYC